MIVELKDITINTDNVYLIRKGSSMMYEFYLKVNNQYLDYKTLEERDRDYDAIVESIKGEYVSNSNAVNPKINSVNPFIKEIKAKGINIYNDEVAISLKDGTPRVLKYNGIVVGRINYITPTGMSVSSKGIEVRLINNEITKIDKVDKR